MSASRLSVVLCVVLASAEQAIAQVATTAEPDVIAAAVSEQIELSNPSPGSFGMGHAVAIEGDTALMARRLSPTGSSASGVRLHARHRELGAAANPAA